MANVVKVSQKPDTNLIFDTKDLGKHIKYKRTLLKLSRENTAQLCSINYKTLENIENGKKNCEVGNVLHVANMLGLKITIEDK